MTLTTIKEYCTLRGVSRQFVYEYIRKKKFTLLELPVFIEWEGTKKEIGKQKFLKVPPEYAVEKKRYWSGDMSDNEYNLSLVADATEDKELQTHILKLFSLKSESAASAYKKDLFENLFPLNHIKRAALDAAFDKCTQLMMAELAELEQQVSNLEKK